MPVTVNDSQNVLNEKSLTGQRRGVQRRKAYTIDFKLKTVTLLETAKAENLKSKLMSVARKMKINKSLVSKWNKDKENILKYKVNNMGSSRAPSRFRRNVTVSTPGCNVSVNSNWVHPLHGKIFLSERIQTTRANFFV